MQFVVPVRITLDDRLRVGDMPVVLREAERAMNAAVSSSLGVPRPVQVEFAALALRHVEQAVRDALDPLGTNGGGLLGAIRNMQRMAILMRGASFLTQRALDQFVAGRARKSKKGKRR